MNGLSEAGRSSERSERVVQVSVAGVVIKVYPRKPIALRVIKDNIFFLTDFIHCWRLRQARWNSLNQNVFMTAVYTSSLMMT